jgi:hypothetical protein
VVCRSFLHFETKHTSQRRTGSDEDEERAHLAHDLEKDEEEVLQRAILLA